MIANTWNIKLLSLSSNRELASKIAEDLNMDLGKLKFGQFADGEINVSIEESVRGSDLYIIQSIAQPINDNLMETLIMIDAVRRASAKKINIVIPYLGYTRQEKIDGPREPIAAKLIANLFTMAGAHRIITVDLHAPQIQSFFEIPIDHLDSSYILYKNLLPVLSEDDDVVVISPDHAGVSRVRKMADYFHAPIGIVHKSVYKEETTSMVVGEVEGKTCIIFDDLIHTGKTVTDASEILMEKGAKKVYVCASHSILSDNALELINESEIIQIFTTDSIHHSSTLNLSKFTFVSISKLIAEAIKLIHDNGSISGLFRKDI